MKNDIEELLGEIHNKLVAPKIAMEKLSKKENVPHEFIELASKELNKVIELVDKLKD